MAQLIGRCSLIAIGICRKAKKFPVYFPITGNQQRRVRSRLHPPPYSLVSAPRLCRAEAMTGEFRHLGHIQGPYFLPIPNC